MEERLQSLRGLTYLDAQARLLKLAAEAPTSEHDLLLHVAEMLRTATQGEGAAHVVVGGVSNLTDEAQTWRRQTLRRLVRDPRARAGDAPGPAGRDGRP